MLQLSLMFLFGFNFFLPFIQFGNIVFSTYSIRIHKIILVLVLVLESTIMSRVVLVLENNTAYNNKH